MVVGEKFYISLGSLRLDESGFCFVDPEADCHKTAGLVNSLEVTRQTDGFHVALLRHFKWDFPRAPHLTKRKWLAVASFTERYDPTLDWATQDKSS